MVQTLTTEVLGDLSSQFALRARLNVGRLPVHRLLDEDREDAGHAQRVFAGILLKVLLGAVHEHLAEALGLVHRRQAVPEDARRLVVEEAHGLHGAAVHLGRHLQQALEDVHELAHVEVVVELDRAGQELDAHGLVDLDDRRHDRHEVATHL